MSSQSLVTNLRIVGAIATKDITQALRNKHSVSLIITALIVVVGYHFLPLLSEAGEPPYVLIYDAGDSALVPLLEASPALRVFEYDSQARMEFLLTDAETPELGLTLPEDFDARLAAGVTPELTGHVLHWVSEDSIERLQEAVEGEIAAALGVVVPIRISEQRVYPTAESGGISVMVGMAFVYVVMLTGLMVPPHLMMEEKQAHTLDALLVSPATPSQIVLGKAASGLAYAVAGGALALLINQAMVIHWGVAIAAAFGGALFGTAVGLLLGSLLQVRQQLMLWAWVVFIPLFIPMIAALLADVLPAPVVAVARWVPSTVLLNLVRAALAARIAPAHWVGPLIYLFGTSSAVLAFVAWTVRRSDR